MHILQPLRRWSRYQEIRRELHRKSDRQLHDMGMSRDRISTIARKAVGTL